MDGDDQLKFTRFSYVSGDYRSRRDLSEAVSNTLSDFYRENSIDESYARDLLSEVILPASAQSAADKQTAQAWA